MKKIIALALALIMVLSMGVVAMASPDPEFEGSYEATTKYEADFGELDVEEIDGTTAPGEKIAVLAEQTREFKSAWKVSYDFTSAKYAFNGASMISSIAWEKDEVEEESAIEKLISLLPYNTRDEIKLLFSEMKEMCTNEAKLYKSLDNIEALISHNEADISTWLPREYEENLTYGQKNCQWSEWTRQLKEVIKQDSIDKIKKEGKK